MSGENANTCPVAGSVVPDVVSRSAIMETSADTALLHLDAFPDVLVEAEAAFREHYFSMAGVQSERAEMLIARNMRNLSLTVMRAVGDEALVDGALPSLRQGQAPKPAYLSLPYGPHAVLPYMEGAGHRQKDIYSLYMNWMTTLYLGAMAAKFAKEEDAPAPYGLLWKHADVAETWYEQTWLAYSETVEQPNPPFQPSGDLRTVVVSGVGNNTMTVQALLLKHQRMEDQHWRSDMDEPYTAHMRRTALAAAGMLLLLSSVNRNVSRRLLPNPRPSAIQGGIPVCIDPRMVTSNPHTVREDASGKRQWDEVSLRRGPWKEPKNCVGEVRHLPTAESRDNIAEAFSLGDGLAGGERLLRGEDGRFRSVTIAFLVGAMVAEQTMYRRKVPIRR